MRNKNFFLEYFVGFGLLLIYLSTYQVSDTQNAIRISNNYLSNSNTQSLLIKRPGLHFKRPLLDRVIFLDKRMQRISMSTNLLNLKNSNIKRIDYVINWRIKEPYYYVQFISCNQGDCSTFLTRWSNQFVQDHWSTINITQSMQQECDSLRENLNKQAEMMGIEILSCHILQKIPTTETQKNILKNMHASEVKRAQNKLQKGKVSADSIEHKAILQASAAYNKAKIKAQKVQNHGELLAMKIYLEAYNQSPKFAIFYQNLQKEALVRSLNR